MAKFSRGQYALSISDRSGLAFPYLEMVREWNGAWVHISEYEPKSPLIQPKPVGADPQSLQRARPARTEFYTPKILPNNPFSTAGTTTLTFSFPFGGLEVNDQVRFTEVKQAVGGVSLTALELNTSIEENKINEEKNSVENKIVENISLENANYLQSLEENSSDDVMPKFEVDSIELASPQLFSEEEMSRETNENQDNSPNEMTMFDQTNPQENLESSTEVKESNEVKEPEMFEEKDSEDDFEIPAFLRRQKN